MTNTYNPAIQDSYYYVDQDNNMMLRQPHAWSPNECGEGDAIGRNLIAFYTYSDYRFIDGIKRCFVWNKKHYQGYRYPTHGGKGISRDHISYALIACKIADSTLPIPLKWRISDFAKFTPDMWCWYKSLLGSKLHLFLFYAMEYPIVVVNILRNKYIYWRAVFSEEMSQKEWVIGNWNNKKIENKWSKKLFQVFAMHNLAWQIKVLPDSKAKKRLQRLVLKMVPRHNYWIKLLLGDKSVTKEQVYSYVLTTGDRPTTILNPEICGRDVHVIKEDFNKLDVDYLRKLYSNSLTPTSTS